MGRGPAEFTAAAARYVCVRITDLSAIDVRNVRFDFDLTFAALVMHADGTILHRYGGRGSGGADEYTSLGSFLRLLQDALVDHAAHERAPTPRPAEPPLPAIDLPVLRTKIASGQRLDCVHCHTVHDAEHVDARLLKTWRPEQAFVHPDPARIGLTLDRERQSFVRTVAPGSPAAAAGLAAGDELLSLGAQRSVRTFTDVQWALHRAPWGDHELPVRWRRGDEEHGASLALPEGWKRCPPEEYAWRPYKWNLSPSAGFGGPALDEAVRTRLGIAAGTFAFRIGYLVDWGENGHRGRAARAAGLQKGDVVVSFAGKSDFVSVDHFHAWIGLTRTAGEEVEIVVLRDGVRRTLRYRLPA